MQNYFECVTTEFLALVKTKATKRQKCLLSDDICHFLHHRHDRSGTHESSSVFSANSTGPELHFVNVTLSMCGPKLKVDVFKISSPRTAVPVREIILTLSYIFKSTSPTQPRLHYLYARWRLLPIRVNGVPRGFALQIINENALKSVTI